MRISANSYIGVDTRKYHDYKLDPTPLSRTAGYITDDYFGGKYFKKLTQ